jgi:type VI secretion system secreted protein VgrG
MLGNRASFLIKAAGLPGARVVRFSGYEGISSLYEFQVEIAAGELEMKGLIGGAVTLTIEGAEGARVVKGELAALEYVGRTRAHSLYELTIAPPVARLLHRQDCRIFQRETTLEVIRAVLKAAGLPSTALRSALVGDYQPRDYCVQYRESDFAFISRLMEEDGIFYWFEHGDAGAVMVLGDHTRAHPKVEGAPLWFNPGGELQRRESVSDLRVSEGMRPGKVSLRDFNFKAPEERLDVDAASQGGDRSLEVYDYPGEYQEATHGPPHHGISMAKIRMEAIEAGRRSTSGSSDCRRLMPGAVFTLMGHPRAELNGELLLTRLVHQGSQPQSLDQDAGSSPFFYSNHFTCIDAKVPFRPPRVTPRPVVRGVQSATVVGAGEEEVFCDEQGRVLVHFHWDRRDREGKTGEELASCWVRVAQLWAGAGWGAMFIPRVGHEVLVDFIEGDPDRPIITGRVYHANHPFPYPLPDEKTKSTIKSDSSPGGAGFNELRFEDRKGGEEVFLHAQRDLNEVVLRNNTRSVGVDQSFSVGGNQSFSVSGNQSFSITKDRSVTVTEGDESLSVVKGKSSTTVKEDRSVTVQSGNSTLTVETGSHTATVKEAITATSTSASVDVKAKTSMSLTAETQGLKATAKTKVEIEAETQTLSAVAMEGVTIASKTATLSASALKEVSVASLASTLSLFSLAPASMTSLAEVNIGAPSGVHVNGGTAATVSAERILVQAGTELTLVVGNSVIVIKPDGIEVSAPKITSTAVGMHVISGALIKIN